MEELEKGYRFRSPAEETLRRLSAGDANFAMIKTKMELIEQALNNLTDNTNDANERITKSLTEIINKFDNLDTKYASKAFENNVTKILWAIGFLIMGGVVTALLRLVLK